MKTLIQLAAVVIVFGGAAATATIFLQPAPPVAAGADEKPATPADASQPDHAAESDPNAESPESGEAATTQPETLSQSPVLETVEKPVVDKKPVVHEAPARPTIAQDTPAPPETKVAVRPQYSPDGDEAGALINALRERSRVATESERRLTERLDSVQLIFEDLHAEQLRTLKIRERLSREMKESRDAVDAAVQAIEADRSALQKEQAESRKAADAAVQAAIDERDKLKKQLEAAAPPAAIDLDKANDAGAPEDNVNLKKMASVFDSMPAENVAKVFEQLVKNKKSAAVVSLMNAMKDRQAAKVLGIIADNNAELAADLTERLKRLKASADKPVTE
jgi:flagellar motility protein MotE (MotC chaperone)